MVDFLFFFLTFINTINTDNICLPYEKENISTRQSERVAIIDCLRVYLFYLQEKKPFILMLTFRTTRSKPYSTWYLYKCTRIIGFSAACDDKLTGRYPL